jgi:hypothetical protein
MGPCGARIDDLLFARCGSRPQRDPGHLSASNPVPRAAAVWPVPANQRSNTATGINTLTCVFYGLDRRKGTIITGRHSVRTATWHHGSNTTGDRKKKAPQ